MFDYIKKLIKEHPEFCGIADDFIGCDGNIECGINGVSFRSDNRIMRYAMGNFNTSGVMDKGEIIAMFSGISVYNDSNSNYYSLSSNLSDYINKLGILKCSIGDIIPVGRYIITYRLSGENVLNLVNVENGAISVYSNVSSETSIYNGFSNLRTDIMFSTSNNDIDFENGEPVFNSLSFVVKFFQCLNEGISVSKTETIERECINRKKGTKRVKTSKYISLSSTGDTRYNELERALERIKSNSVYSVASWYRRPHYRKGNVYVKGVWCSRNESLLSNDDREVIYTM